MTADRDFTPLEIELARKCRGLTQAQAADLMGVSLRTYVSLESGSAPIRKLHSNAFRWALLHEDITRLTVEAAVKVCMEQTI